MKKEIEIQRDNLILHGILETPDSEEQIEKISSDNKIHKRKLVILMHGMLMSSKSYLIRTVAQQLQKEGFATLRMDFEAHGMSQGRMEDMTIPAEVLDAEAFLKYALTIPWVSDIIFLGHSQGALVATLLAGQYPQIPQAMVLLSAAGGIEDNCQHGSCADAHFEPDHIPERLTMFGTVMGGDYFRTALHLHTFESCAPYQGPVLLIHGTDDHLVPLRYPERYHQIYENSELILIQGADHDFRGYIEEVNVNVMDFLRAFLL